MISFCFFFSSRRRHTRFKCDWSSDVCSSDLARLPSQEAGFRAGQAGLAERNRSGCGQGGERLARPIEDRNRDARRDQIGRASCRERGEISVVAVSLKKKKRSSREE